IQQLQGQSQSQDSGKASDNDQQHEVLESALNEIWMGQSNDVLWHGVFGGLYLTNLRTANYQHLLKAENIVDKALRGDRFFEIKTHDIDCDGQPEILIETQVQNLYLTPQDGGALFELDFRPRNFNLLDTLARRYEAYHDKLSQAVFSEGGEADSAESIHHRVVTKEKGLEKILFYDAHRRMSLMDHFWGPGTDLDQVFQNTCSEVGDFIGKPYAVDVQRDHVSLERAGYLQGANGAYTPVSVKKTLWVEKDKAETLIRYEIKSLQEKTSEAPIDVCFSPEFNVNFLAPDAPDRYYYLPETTSIGGSDSKPAGVDSGVAVKEKPLAKLKSTKMVSRGSLEAIEAIGLRDEWMGIDYALFFNQPTTVWRFPVETVSQSEAGFEKIYQSSALYPNWQFKLAPQETWTVDIRQRILAV
ncbi:MAG: DUF1926 domain-containing protein, partial [Cyanobacteria bacterium]|nr:DUF1926 domain-containing protein [Cyanobacteriota bacterium]